MTATHLHHRTPRHLLRLYRKASAGETDGAGVEAWLEWEGAAVRYGVPVEISATDLEELVEGSAVLIPADAHQVHHSTAGDFVRWGRMGGLEVLRRYGTDWFALLALRRWGRISPADLEAARPLR